MNSRDEHDQAIVEGWTRTAETTCTTLISFNTPSPCRIVSAMLPGAHTVSRC